MDPKFDALFQTYAQRKEAMVAAQTAVGAAATVIEKAIKECRHYFEYSNRYEPYVRKRNDQFSGYPVEETTDLYVRFEIRTCRLCGIAYEWRTPRTGSGNPTQTRYTDICKVPYTGLVI